MCCPCLLKDVKPSLRVKSPYNAGTKHLGSPLTSFSLLLNYFIYFSDKKDKDKDKEKDSKREKKKYETVDPALLLACVYYDQNHCGYLQDRDLEDIIFSLGLNLSRAQVT